MLARLNVRTARAVLAAALLLGLGAGCSDDDEVTNPVDQCGAVALPLQGSAEAPSVTDVGLEVQTSGIVVVATVFDPQGSENLRDLLQTIGVFPDGLCASTPITIQDDIAASGVEETFGTVVVAADNPALYSAIAASNSWPVEVDFVDVDGHRTTGRVRARIIR